VSGLIAAAFAAVAALVALLLVYGVGYAALATLRAPPLGRQITVQGARLHVLEGGDPASPDLPVLFLHGASANLREWLISVTPLLPDRRWVAMDRPGLGHSSAPAGAQFLDVQAGAALGVLDALGIERAVIAAHSLGSAAALRLALDHPQRVAGLVLCAPACNPYPGDNSWHVRLAAHPVWGPLFCWLAVPVFGPVMARAGVAATFAPAQAPPAYAVGAGLALLFRPWTFAANARQVRATRTEFRAQAPRYPQIAAPLIILTADKDSVVSPKLHARPLAAAVPGAVLEEWPGAGHMPHHIYPSAVADAVRRVAESRTDR
jgi:pimeloyl-ACP methyl ester carboxylesterase